MNTFLNWFIATASQGGTALWIWSWQTLVLLSFIWLGVKASRIKSPALRHHVWLFGLIAVVLLPLATLASRALPIVHPTDSTLTFVVEAPHKALEVIPVLSAQPRLSQIQKPSPSSQPSGLNFMSIVFVIWLTGALAGLFRFTRGHMAIKRALRDSRLISTRSKNGRAEVRLSDKIDSPLLFGLSRPVILLPADIDDWTTSEERSAMVQHELAHLKRRDPFVNLFQSAVRVVLFFHPLARLACRQMSLERELACDDQVVASGAGAPIYIESLLKVAERSFALKSAHHLAFFSAKSVLERRIEMILRNDHSLIGKKHWKSMLLAVVLIAAIGWLLIPAGGTGQGLAQQLDESSRAKLKIVRQLGNEKAYDELVEMALRNPDPELKRLAAIRLTELEGDGSTAAMVSLYEQTDDAEVKTMLIDSLARISEIEPLTKIASSDPSEEYRLRATRRIKFLKATSDSGDVKNWDVSAIAAQLNQVPPEPPPPPPPPRPSRGKKLPPPPPPPPPRASQS